MPTRFWIFCWPTKFLKAPSRPILRVVRFLESCWWHPLIYWISDEKLWRSISWFHSGHIVEWFLHCLLSHLIWHKGVCMELESDNGLHSRIFSNNLGGSLSLKGFCFDKKVKINNRRPTNVVHSTATQPMGKDTMKSSPYLSKGTCSWRH